MPIKYLTQAELEQLFSVIHAPRDRSLFTIIYHYGLRVSEATRLKLSDVNLDRETIYITRLKGGISGLKPLMKPTARTLRTYLPVRQPTGDGLFTGRQGNLKRHRIAQLFKGYADQVGLGDYRVHCLRHSIATLLLEEGFPAEMVQDHLGHRSIQSTLIYTHFTDTWRREMFAQMQQSRAITVVGV